MQTNNDWKQINPNTPEGRRQLDIVIMKRLGWTVIDLNDREDGARVKGPNWALIDLHGKTRGWAFTADDAWAEGPKISEDMNVAFPLLPQIHDGDLVVRSGIEVRPALIPPNDKGVTAFIEVHSFNQLVYGCDDTPRQRFFAFHEVPATAVCLAWLPWKDATDE